MAQPCRLAAEGPGLRGGAGDLGCNQRLALMLGRYMYTHTRIHIHIYIYKYMCVCILRNTGVVYDTNYEDCRQEASCTVSLLSFDVAGERGLVKER